MLDENYNCKVIDFGDAKKVDEPPIEDEDEPLPEEEKKEDEFQWERVQMTKWEASPMITARSFLQQ